jgi:hypothetical protein
VCAAIVAASVDAYRPPAALQLDDFGPWVRDVDAGAADDALWCEAAAAVAATLATLASSAGASEEVSTETVAEAALRCVAAASRFVAASARLRDNGNAPRLVADAARVVGTWAAAEAAGAPGGAGSEGAAEALRGSVEGETQIGRTVALASVTILRAVADLQELGMAPDVPASRRPPCPIVARPRS